jgi:hypothetical protein
MKHAASGFSMGVQVLLKPCDSHRGQQSKRPTTTEVNNHRGKQSQRSTITEANNHRGKQSQRPTITEANNHRGQSIGNRNKKVYHTHLQAQPSAKDCCRAPLPSEQNQVFPQNQLPLLAPSLKPQPQTQHPHPSGLAHAPDPNFLTSPSDLAHAPTPAAHVPDPPAGPAHTPHPSLPPRPPLAVPCNRRNRNWDGNRNNTCTRPTCRPSPQQRTASGCHSHQRPTRQPHQTPHQPHHLHPHPASVAAAAAAA